jgi:hypothetical protein
MATTHLLQAIHPPVAAGVPNDAENRAGISTTGVKSHASVGLLTTLLGGRMCITRALRARLTPRCATPTPTKGTMMWVRTKTPACRAGPALRPVFLPSKTPAVPNCHRRVGEKAESCLETRVGQTSIGASIGATSGADRIGSTFRRVNRPGRDQRCQQHQCRQHRHPQHQQCRQHQCR